MIFKCLYNLTSVFVKPRIIILCRKNTVMVMEYENIIVGCKQIKETNAFRSN